MKKTIVYFYSKKGNNRFLAEKIADELTCDIEKIRPRLSSFPMILLGATCGIRKLKNLPGKYDRVVLCGPVFVGKFISPLRHFVEKYMQNIRELVFITCCGSGYEQKDEKFGHGHVFSRLREMLGDKCVLCEAFPIPLVLPEDQRKDPDSVMKTRLSEDNFKGEISERFGRFISGLRN
jgi:hypothetical protein